MADPENATKEDTFWSIIRWAISLRLMAWGMKMAPDGTAKTRLAQVNRDWCDECRSAWDRRYPKVGGYDV